MEAIDWVKSWLVVNLHATKALSSSPMGRLKFCYTKHGRRAFKSRQKRGNYFRSLTLSHKQLYLEDVPSAKERWLPQTNNRPVEHFKMEGIHLLKDMLQEADRMVKLDLKDACFAVPIHKDHRWYLETHWKGTRYQFNCLPFGLSSGPRVFMKIMLPAIAWLRLLGCRLLTYINNNLILASTREEATCLAEIAVSMFEALGFVVNHPKSILQPCQELQFLGFNVNLVDMTICVPQTKLEKMRMMARDLLQATTTSENKKSKSWDQLRAFRKYAC